MYMFPYLAGVWSVQVLGIIQQIRDHNGDSYMVYI